MIPHPLKSADGGRQQTRVWGWTRDVKAHLMGCFIPKPSLSFDHHEAGQSTPLLLMGQIGHLSQRHYPNLPIFSPMVPGFSVVTVMVVDAHPLGAFRLLKKRLHRLMQGALIPFECQDIVSSLLADLSGNLPLRPHSIEGDHQALF